MKKLALFLLATHVWGQTTINGDRAVMGRFDLSGATGFFPPVVLSDPAGTCSSPSGKANLVLSLATGTMFTCAGGIWHASSGSNGLSPTLRGQWDSSQTYNPLDVVTYQGGSWWATAGSSGVTPGADGTKWVQIAAAGTAGATGLSGATGPSGKALNARGIWASGASYAALDSVSYNSSTYVAVAASTNVVPGTDATKWNVVGVAQSIAVQSAGAAVAAQNALNFAVPLAAVSNAGQSRIDVSCATCEANTNKGAANGYAPLDATSHVPAANLPNAFQSTNSQLAPDSGGGTLLETSSSGILVQKSGLVNSGTPQQGYSMGGLHMIGNGYANDPAWAALSSGATTDLGTFTARASSSNSFTMQDGTMNFFADTNLTPGNNYTPTGQIAISPAGFQISPHSADPGCTNAGHVGRFWINTASGANSVAVCVGTSSYSWAAPVTQVAAAGSAKPARSKLNFLAPFSVTDNAALGSSDVSVPVATSSTNGYLASADWTSFNAKASSGSCGANQFVNSDRSSGGPSCAQPAFSNLTGAATKAQEVSTTVFTDQSNQFTAGTQDFSAAAHTIPLRSGTVSSMPTSCSAGEMYLASDQAREAVKQCNSAGLFQSPVGIVTSGLIADYWMGKCDGTVGSGTVLADCSGSGNAGTVPSGGNPAWTQQGLTWATAVNAPVILPTAVLNGMVTIQLYADMSVPTNYNNTAQIQAFLSAGSSIVMWGNVLAVTPLCCGIYGAWNGTPATQEIDPAVGPNLFTYILDNTSDTICIGANCNLSYYSRGGNNPATRSGPLMLGGNNTSGQMSGTIYRAMFYNRALTAAEVAQNDGAVDSWVRYKGVNRGKYAVQTASNTLICVGDSITQGKGATPACSTGMMTGLSDTFQIYNMAMAGEYLANMVTAAPKFASGINPNGKSNIAWIFAGTNDMCVPSNTLTPAQTLQKMIAFSRYMRGQGAKVMVFPMLSRTGSYQGTTCDALHDQYNALLMQNWPSFADAFVYGLANDVNLTGDGAYANATYFQSDGIHPTNAGQQLIAGYAQSEINNLLTGTTNLAGVRESIAVKKSSYTATMGDSVILCNASTGAFTVSLPSAAGIAGRSFQVKKTDSSGNACTVAATSSQTIDGAASVSLSSQYSSKKMESDGGNWQVIQ